MSDRKGTLLHWHVSLLAVMILLQSSSASSSASSFASLNFLHILSVILPEKRVTVNIIKLYHMGLSIRTKKSIADKIKHKFVIIKWCVVIDAKGYAYVMLELNKPYLLRSYTVH